MELQEFLDNKNFVMGHKVKVKSLEELKTLGLSDWKLRDIEELAGLELVSSELYSEDSLYVYFTTDPSWKYRRESVPLSAIEFTDDSRVPSDKSIKYCSELINSETNYFFMGTSGEVHGSGKGQKLTEKNCYPMLSLEGKSLIHLPNAGVSGGGVKLKTIKKLIKEKSHRFAVASASRQYKLLTEEECNKKAYSY